MEIDGLSGIPIERISFTPPTLFRVNQNETAWFAGDQWAITPRLTLNLGIRFDNDTITLPLMLLLARDFCWHHEGRKTFLKGGVGLFYDRVPLMVPVFPDLPNRTVTVLSQTAKWPIPFSIKIKLTANSTTRAARRGISNLIASFSQTCLLRLAYEQRNTTSDFVVSPFSSGYNRSPRAFQWRQRFLPGIPVGGPLSNSVGMC